MGKKSYTGPTGAIVGTGTPPILPPNLVPSAPAPPQSRRPSNDRGYVVSRVVEDRKCRDVLFLILFVLFWIGMLIVAGSAFAKGDPRRLVYGLDYRGNLCGASDAQPNLVGFDTRYWMNPQQIYDSGNPLDPFSLSDARSICLKGCPEVSNTSLSWVCDYPEGPKPPVQDMETWAARNYDYYDLLTPQQKNFSANLQGPCYPVLLPSDNFFWSCQPQQSGLNTEAYATWRAAPVNGIQVASSNSQYYADAVKALLNQPAAILNRYVADLGRAWLVLVVCAGVAPFILGFVFLILMRFLAGLMTWLFIIGVNLLLIAVVLYTYAKAGVIGSDAVNALIGESAARQLDLTGTTGQEATDLKYVAIALTIFTVLFIIFTIIMIKRIRIAIGVVQVACKAIGHIPSLVFFPIFPVIAVAALGVYWVAVTIYLFSAGTIEPTQGCDIAGCCQYSVFNSTFQCGVENCCGYDIQYNTSMKWVLLYHLFGLLWTSHFVVGVSLCIIAGGVSSYYWSRGDISSVPLVPLFGSVYRTFRYHLGSVAFGSLLVATVELVRFIAAYLQRKLKEAGQGSWTKWLCCCVQCWLGCLEWIVNFINRNAYIMIAIKGKGFCSSAQTAAKLLFGNVLRVAAVNVIGDFVLFLGKMAVSLACAVFAFLMLDGERYKTGQDKISSPLAPVLFVWGVAFIIASIFFGVVEMAVDTVLLAFCEDCEENGGVPRYAPPLLMDALSRHAKALDEEDAQRKAQLEVELAKLNRPRA
ncbi:hypothetical protein KFL_001330110 [Klebsormidium nitens]|uniref:Choline transporter-like protein n=1 Tax=Klebsormidium nitens TaxID=105231 RepID=A0A0U9HLH5_KLENI|nr:hypothetical protein KFL_001330110 [Klebsormidium nitens]|eukprot:GAQ83028.1 hypothetical protein KFL_001330110 [Klebsormidium nitens]